MARVELFLGCMFAGKTERVLTELRKFRAIGRRILVVVHSADQARYEDGAVALRTHSRMEETGPCVLAADRLLPLLQDPRFQEAQVIGIDEVQFFPDLVDFILAVEDQDKHILMSGLDGDADRREFGQTLQVIPLCDTVVKLQAFDTVLRDETPAAFSLRRVGGEVCQGHNSHSGTPLRASLRDDVRIGSAPGQVQVGGAESYHAVSRRTWLAQTRARAATDNAAR